MSDEELIDVLSNSLAMVYAPRLEPFGYAPLEANACGTPVIAVAEGGVRETVVDGVNGLLVDHDPNTFGRAIERLQQDRDFAEQLGKRGKELVRTNWSLDRSVDRLEKLLALAPTSVTDAEYVGEGSDTTNRMLAGGDDD